MGGSDDEDEGADDWARMQEVELEPESDVFIDFEPAQLQPEIEPEIVCEPAAAATAVAAAAATIAAVIDAAVELSVTSDASARPAPAASPESGRSSSDTEVQVPSLEEITAVVTAEVVAALQAGSYILHLSREN
jgi:hypothetical protein